uniref:Uncharacterized protein n=1 Tax=Spironucleus salmonicida TaxID=348837 RepID=V6LMH7_9EUKA|eukprot:EST45897.1 Hypothetical protein SS50377_14142 [Spironucleus salmonicida]
MESLKYISNSRIYKALVIIQDIILLLPIQSIYHIPISLTSHLMVIPIKQLIVNNEVICTILYPNHQVELTKVIFSQYILSYRPRNHVALQVKYVITGMKVSYYILIGIV